MLDTRMEDTSSSLNSGVCLACGAPAFLRDRRLIGEEGKDSDITTLWRRIAARELEKRGENGDPEDVLRKCKPFICRKCHRAYNNVVKGMKVNLNLTDHYE